MDKFKKWAAVAGITVATMLPGKSEGKSSSMLKPVGETEKVEGERSSKYTPLVAKESVSNKFSKTEDLSGGPDDEPEIDPSEGPLKTLNISAFFNTATTEFIDVNAKENAKQSIRAFLEDVDLRYSKITVIGTYSVQRPWVNNQNIAEARRLLGMNLLLEVLSEKYSVEEINAMQIESEAKGKEISEQEKSLTGDELERAIDKAQGIEIKVEAREKYIPDPEGITENPYTSIEDFKNVHSVVVDASSSMVKDAEEVEKTLLEIKNKLGRNINKITLEGGDNEMHIRTLYKAVKTMGMQQTPVELLIITDEPDKSFFQKDEYIKLADDLIKMANRYHIKIIFKAIKPEKGGESVVVEFSEKTRDLFYAPPDNSVTYHAVNNKWFNSMQKYKKTEGDVVLITKE